MEPEIIDSCRATGLFKGIIDGGPSDSITPRPHEEIVAIAMLIQPVQSLAGSLIDRNGFPPHGFGLHDGNHLAFEVHVFPFQNARKIRAQPSFT
jgi:hypothetical protein